MSDYKLTMNTKGIFNECVRAFTDTSLLYERALTNAISDPVYDWPIAPSPRDIVDTGKFRASQNAQRTGKLETTYTWSTDYAAYLRFGYTTRGGNKMPARNFEEVALKKIKLKETFQRILNSKLGR